MLGPIDYLVVGFDGDNFDGSIMNELSNAIDSGVIRLVDLVFIIKDEEGNVQAAEVEDQSEDLQQVFKALGHTNDSPLLTEGDIEKLAKKMPDGTSAGVLIIEQLWAKGLKKALIHKGGILLAEGRIRDDTVMAAVDDLAKVSM